MWVTLKNRTVHKSTRVTFVRITNQVFGFPWSASAKAPLHPGRKAAAPTSPQAGAFNSVDDFGRLHGYGFFDPGKTLMGKKIIETFRIDGSTTGEDDTLLFFKKLGVIRPSDLLLNGLVAQYMLLDDLRHQLRSTEIVGHRSLAGDNHVDQYVVGTQSTTTGANHIATLADLGFDSLLGKLRFKGVGNRLRAGG